MSPDCAGEVQGRVRYDPVTCVKGETPSSFTTFWANVHVTPACWLWQGSTLNGYGRYQKRGAHRLAWELTHGPIPKGLHILHKCDVPACVNTDHLFLGTHKVNMEDAARKGRLHVSRPKRQTVSDEAVASIFIMRQQGALLQQIANAIGTSKTFVSMVLKGKRRQHPQPRSAA